MPPFATPQNTHYQGNGATRLPNTVGSDPQGPGEVQSHPSNIPVFGQVIDELSIQGNQARPAASITNQSGLFSPNSGLPLYALNPNAIPLSAPQVRISAQNINDPKSNIYQSQVHTGYPVSMPYASHVYQYPTVYPQYYSASAPYPYGYAIQMMPVTPPNSMGSLSSNASEQSPQTPYHGVSTYSNQNSSIDHSPLNGYPYSNNSASYMAFSPSGPVSLQSHHEYPRLGSYVRDALDRHPFAYLLSLYPTIPWAIPAVYTAKTSLKTLEESLQNPLRIKNVYIRGLAPGTTDELLLAYAARFGKVVTHKAMIEPQNGACKGLGFLETYGSQCSS
ncbi:MAG: hypothetical protein M1840_000685 [Geoglossum simile]|nr:MAG: hypothetical protein M1840_000685 [Geoglossum simile]